MTSNTPARLHITSATHRAPLFLFSLLLFFHKKENIYSFLIIVVLFVDCNEQKCYDVEWRGWRRGNKNMAEPAHTKTWHRSIVLGFNWGSERDRWETVSEKRNTKKKNADLAIGRTMTRKLFKHIEQQTINVSDPFTMRCYYRHHLLWKYSPFTADWNNWELIFNWSLIKTANNGFK